MCYEFYHPYEHIKKYKRFISPALIKIHIVDFPSNWIVFRSVRKASVNWKLFDFFLARILFYALFVFTIKIPTHSNTYKRSLNFSPFFDKWPLGIWNLPFGSCKNLCFVSYRLDWGAHFLYNSHCILIIWKFFFLMNFYFA